MTPITEAATPDQALNRLLWERCRVGAAIIIFGIAAMFVGELSLHPGERLGIHVVQLLNIGAVAVCLFALRAPAHSDFNRAVCLLGFTATAIGSGAVGILARDPPTTLVVLVALSLGVAVLVPWGARYQLSAAVVAIGAAIWTLTTIHPDSRDLWTQPVGSLLPTFGASVIVAHLLRRQSLAVAQAVHERRTRENGLREANRRLEVEVRDHESTERSLRFALLELDHRVKNALATLQSMAEQTLESSTSAEDFTESFRGRIRAMARIHTGLAARQWEGIDLPELVDLVVGPYCINGNNLSCRCDHASLTSEEARTLGTALDELATNAAKYGALSLPEGRVDINATVSDASQRRLQLVWSEYGGPSVREPERRGLGTKLIEVALAYETGGEVELSFAETGVRCTMDMPLSSTEGTR